MYEAWGVVTPKAAFEGGAESSDESIDVGSPPRRVNDWSAMAMRRRVSLRAVTFARFTTLRELWLGVVSHFPPPLLITSLKFSLMNYYKQLRCSSILSGQGIYLSGHMDTPLHRHPVTQPPSHQLIQSFNHPVI